MAISLGSEFIPSKYLHFRRITIRWNGPGMLRDLETKLYDVSG